MSQLRKAASIRSGDESRFPNARGYPGYACRRYVILVLRNVEPIIDAVCRVIRPKAPIAFQANSELARFAVELEILKNSASFAVSVSKCWFGRLWCEHLFLTAIVLLPLAVRSKLFVRICTQTNQQIGGLD